MIQFNIITIFPEVFETYFNTSIIKRAQQKKLVKIKIHNLRDFTKGRHKQVDDKPYGGGPGMILMAEPIIKAIKKIKRRGGAKIILLTPTGRQFDQKIAQQFSKLKQLILICGRYEGVDARVEKFVDEKISVGPYVLSGGELPAMTIIEAITRLVPRVIRPESLIEETFTLVTNYKSNINIEIPKNSSVSNSYIRKKFVIDSGVEYPQYTRPEVLTIGKKNGKIKNLKVPKVLLSGHHQEIKKWRNKK